MSERKVVINNSLMPDEMRQDAVDCATRAYIEQKNKTVCQNTEVM